MLSVDRRAAFARHTRLLALALEVLVLLALLSGAIPFAIAQPVWWLRLSDAALNLAPVVLLAVILLRLGCVLAENGSNDALLNGRRSYQLATRWAFLMALLVPLQLIGFAWLWADSDSQLNRQISQGDNEVAALRSRLMGSRSEAELRNLLAAIKPGPLPPLRAGTLVEQKQQLSEAVALNVGRLNSSLRDQRAAMLRSSLPGTLRVFLGAGIVSAFLLVLRREI